MKYDAFISYRHLERDMFVAKRVHKALETTKIPRKIQKEIGRKKIDRVFRDQEELPIGSDLGSNIEAALREAAFLVVICSPQTKDSYWVMKEIDTFIAMHGRENILAVLVDGEPADSFPPQLLTDENGNLVEPLAADVRGKNKKEVKKKLKTETLRLAASILHVDYDDLKQRHRERQMRRNVGIAAAIAAIAVAFGGYTAYNLAKINEEYQQKLVNEARVIAATSLDVLDDGDAKTAALVAMEGIGTEENGRPYVTDPVFALSQALGTYNLGLNLEHDLKLNHDVNISDFAINEDGNRVISVDNNNKIYIWNLDNGECTFKKPVDVVEEEDDRIRAVGFAGDIAVVASDYYLRGYNDQGELQYEYAPEDGITFAKVDDFGKYVAIKTAYYDDEYEKHDYVEIVDATTGESLKKYENQTQTAFGATMMFDKDGKTFYIEHLPGNDEDPNYATVIDLTTDDMIDIPVEGGAIMDIVPTKDGDVAIASMSYDALMSYENAPMHIYKCDRKTGEIKWSRDVDYIGGALSTSYSHLGSRILDIDGVEYPQLIINGTKKMYILDLYSGEDVSSFSTNGFIQNYMMSGSSQLLFVGTSDGKLSYYDALTGEVADDGLVDVSDSLIDFDIKNAVFVSSGFRSPNLTVLKFNADEDYVAKTEMDTGFYGGAAMSPSGDTYVLQTSNDAASNAYTCRVFETATGEEIGTIDIDGGRYGKLYYLDEDTIIFPTYGGSVLYYSVSDKKTEEVKISEEDLISTDYAISTNLKYVAYGDDKEFYVIDTQARKIIYSGEVDFNFWNIAVSNDGKTVYGIDVYGKAYKVNAISGKSKPIFEDYKVNDIKTSQDDNIIAVITEDGYLRVYNWEIKKAENTIEYYGDNYSYVEFSKDNNLLYLQGDDLYFRIYDRQQDKNVFLMSNQINDLSYTIYDEEKNQLSIFNYTDMYIIDLNTYGFIDYAEYGRLYIPQAQVIVSAYGTTMTEFNVKTQDDLIEKVKEKYGDAKLTELQKLKYLVQ
ncbi:DNA-binding beta-propeller fold protein YncE [Pseudobutyrivibrio sp. JW11]|uniref:toll/interleukin-1 receptor domain-containing protein n=1 Tax=Pseudobutyrivibrio sp. JW11 TaxID=1855302 RepID=UPI0008E0EEFB|nr:TIR domain-containing protein [Pseudobutyrivibrio sp. JW11]SFO60586.1 DNA-binding beta-propeller fold protein YncE [Pseudobutyrivibrio sp. JW11]